MNVDGDFRRPPKFKDRQASGYGFVVNSLGNPFGTDFRRSEVDVSMWPGTVREHPATHS